MKKLLLFLAIICCITPNLMAKELNFLMQKARENYPELLSRKSNQEILELENKNLKSAWFPQINLEAQGTYQSEVVELPINLPNFAAPDIPQFQYRTTLNINQMVYDGNAVSTGIETQITKNNIKNIEIDINKESLDRRIADLYFAILINKDKKLIFQNHRDRLETELNRLNSLYDNGVITISGVNRIKLEITNLDREIYSVETEIYKLVESLELFTLEDILVDEISLQNVNLVDNNESKRSEYELFEAYRELQNNMIETSKVDLYPKVSVFAQAGAGSPNPLNFFDDELTPYYIVGFKLNWKLYDWNGTKRKKEIAELEIRKTNDKESGFNQALEVENISLNNNTIKYDNMLRFYDNAIELQEEIANEKSLQVEQGESLISDYLTELNKLNDYKFNKQMNIILKEKEQINKLLINGNYKL